MIRLCSRFDSVLFTPKMSAIPSYGNYSRSPKAYCGVLKTYLTAVSGGAARKVRRGDPLPKQGIDLLAYDAPRGGCCQPGAPYIAG
jgi:hypothetical protein